MAELFNFLNSPHLVARFQQKFGIETKFNFDSECTSTMSSSYFCEKDDFVFINNNSKNITTTNNNNNGIKNSNEEEEEEDEEKEETIRNRKKNSKERQKISNPNKIETIGPEAHTNNTDKLNFNSIKDKVTKTKNTILIISTFVIYFCFY
jgi:hypothetical protein